MTYYRGSQKLSRLMLVLVHSRGLLSSVPGKSFHAEDIEQRHVGLLLFQNRCRQMSLYAVTTYFMFHNEGMSVKIVSISSKVLKASLFQLLLLLGG